eukprot:TRINITY_DN2544_c0_g1_i2.p1 TRINITY_DN2544_c0_g1~~TRINITY_DN2544_c0_g1_i2.p1  ORF type:complete len:181 (-),score=14.52 TRINITY_DN2544_c0_g1_i2:765-1307(-)
MQTSVHDNNLHTTHAGRTSARRGIGAQHADTDFGVEPAQLMGTPALECQMHPRQHKQPDRLCAPAQRRSLIRLAEMFDGGEVDLKGKTVFELGAGAGLPGLIAALCGASKVLITDYGTAVDHSLVEAIERNIDALSPHVPQGCLHAAPHVWGGSVQPLLDVLGEGHKFDVILLADLLFNR